MAPRTKRPARKSGGGDPSAPGLPSREDLVAFLTGSPDKAAKRDIARAFNIRGQDRIALKRMIRELQDEGLIEGSRKSGLRRKDALPPVTVIDIVDQDTDGELLGRPGAWSGDGPPPKILLAPGEARGMKSGPAIGIGDRVLARLKEIETGLYEASVIKRIGMPHRKILGVFERTGSGRKGEARVRPVDRRARHDILVAPHETGKAASGDLVMVELLPTRMHGAKRGRVLEVFCKEDDPRAIGLISIHSHGIPTEFPEEVIAEAEAQTPKGLEGREDLRDLDLVTIDPEDARDHDDAVLAMPDPSEKNPGGHIVLVAIADVSAYVASDGALDREARKRGNSTYLPDRVIPMLPEKLSADLCSLHENEDKACLAVRMVFDAKGKKRAHSFHRAIMRSRASLTYDQAIAAHYGHPDAVTEPLLDTVIRPLFAAYASVLQARELRQPLELDLAEHKVEMGEDGFVQKVTVRERHDAHRLIEEFMILANVCAAETLERRKVPLLYRAHDAPDREKLKALSDFLDSVGLNLAKGQTIQPMHFNRIIEKSRGTESETLISEVILRSQSQANYSPENLGHFGLNLRRYAHFTSPIRRYADLIVHRGLVRACGLGEDGLTDQQAEELETIGVEISGHERRSMAAERDAMDRFIASYMQDRVGETFTGRICGVTRFGLFVKLDATGADGLVPIRTLGRERFEHDEQAHALIGEDTGDTYRLGDPVEVSVEEAAPMTGGLRFELLSEPGHHTPRKERKPKGRAGGFRDARGVAKKTSRKPSGKPAKKKSAGKGRKKG